MPFNYTLSFPTQAELEAAHEAARAAGNSLAGHLRNLLTGGPAPLFAMASGGQLDAATVRYALDTADAVLDDGSFGGDDIGRWLSDADFLTAWLKGRPYDPAGTERVLSWWGSMPDSVRDAMRRAVA